MPQPLLRSSEKLSLSGWWCHRVHALLGLYCLCHFVHRFRIFFLESDEEDMGFDPNIITTTGMIQIFAPHMLLQLSGFAFAIPQKRYADGFRIWPQYRWEGFVFVLRTVSLLAVAWHRKLYGCKHNSSINSSANEAGSCTVWLSTAIVLAASMGADAVAGVYAKLGQQTNTLRDVNSAPPGLTYLAASAQFHATLHCIMTCDRLCVQFAALMVLQVTAFFLTLRRKCVINIPTGIALYGLVLLLGMATIVRDLTNRGILGIGLTLGNAAALTRLELRPNKYVLWSGVALLFHFLATQNVALSDDNLGGKWVWRGAAMVSFGCLLVGALKRQSRLVVAGNSIKDRNDRNRGQK